MPKIKRGLSDADMLKGYKEDNSHQSLFDIAKEFDKKNSAKETSKAKKDSLSPALIKDIESALLKLQVNLFNKGVRDYKISVKIENDQIILYPAKKKA